jgi:F0F1-type ATP synthase assembly protein I
MLNKWIVMSFLWQISFFILVAVVVNYVLNEESGLSALLGGLAYSVPSFLANVYMNKPTQDNPYSVVSRAYISNVYKLLITAGVLVYIFKEVTINPAVLICCYCLGSVVQFVTSFLSINRE